MIVGFSVFEKLKKNFDFNKYNEINVIITHLHNDHAGSLSQFILYLWFVYHKKTMVISKCKKIKEYLEITGTPSEAFRIVETYQNLEFIKTDHSPYLDTYGFVLEIDNKRIVYTADTAILSPFIPYLENCNECYVDVSKFGGVHLKFEDIITDLEKIKNKGTSIFLMHIDDWDYISKLNDGRFFM